MTKLIPVRDEKLLIENNIPITQKTLRKWHHIKRFPEIFVKVGGKLFVDLDAWGTVVMAAIEKRDIEITGLKKRGVI